MGLQSEKSGSHLAALWIWSRNHSLGSCYEIHGTGLEGCGISRLLSGGCTRLLSCQTGQTTTRTNERKIAALKNEDVTSVEVATIAGFGVSLQVDLPLGLIIRLSDLRAFL